MVYKVHAEIRTSEKGGEGEFPIEYFTIFVCLPYFFICSFINNQKYTALSNTNRNLISIFIGKPDFFNYRSVSESGHTFLLQSKADDLFILPSERN